MFLIAALAFASALQGEAQQGDLWFALNPQETPAAKEPWENDPIVTGESVASIVWARQTVEGDRYWVKADEVEPHSGKLVSLWMHGDHHLNKTVKYRSSLWRMNFWCDGTFQVVATSKFDAAGRQLSSWDGIGQTIHIRPGTIYQDIEKWFCP